ncbi:MAG: hypothetical protein NT062_28620, partial [Proteobacteria bacterium]|nr:hypothetical protein [Pseudomonadota bacterium]
MTRTPRPKGTPRAAPRRPRAPPAAILEIDGMHLWRRPSPPLNLEGAPSTDELAAEHARVAEARAGWQPSADAWALLERLRSAGLAYPCWCTRAEVARAASAP